MNWSLRLFSLAFLYIILPSPLVAQVKLPKPPDNYDVEFRYRIKAGVNARIVQFTDMEKYFKKLGFKRTETDDSDLDIFDPNAERMYGVIPSATARDLLKEPHVETVLLVPAGFKPADDAERVKVLIELNAGFTLERQQLFGVQIKQILAGFGFQEATSYDHRGYTLLRGTMPWIKVATLLKDLRGQPSGWFLPLTHEDDLPEPFKTKLPIRLVEVLPEDGAPAPVTGQAELPKLPADQPHLVKLSAEAQRTLLVDGKIVPARVEVILSIAPDEFDKSWRERIREADPFAAIEGQIGHVVTLTGNAGAVARLPFVVAVRLPRSLAAQGGPAAKDEPKKEEPKKDEKKDEPKEKVRRDALILAQAADAPDVLKELRLDRFHAQGQRGTGVRIAIIDTDFTGWEKFVGKELPASTHYVDLTAERNREIQPEPLAVPPAGIGHGTHCALAVRLAAPDADIALVRIAPDAPYEVMTAHRAMVGDFNQPESFRIRREELEIDAFNLRGDAVLVNEQYRKAFDDFDDDEPARERRRAAKAAVADIEQRQNALTARANRLLKLERDLFALRGATVILCAVGWNTGQALDAVSPLSRYLDRRMGVSRPSVVLNASKRPRPTLWFQPAGDTRGQAWLGDFHDADGNGLMEFAPLDAPLKPGRWTPELNFLAFRNSAQLDEVDLPAETRLRIAIQWREPHDPEISEFEYRQPIAPLNLLLLRQRDPNADKLATDELELIARSDGNPERLHGEREFGIYEQTIEVTLPAGGRYALRVEGRHPNSIRPGGSLGIREQEVRWELTPRIFLEVLDAPTRAKGRVVFGDYQTPLGGVMVPADARTVVALGAVNASRKPQPYSAIGAGIVSDLFIKPDVMGFDQLPKLGDGTGPAKGTALSAAMATGLGACLLSAGAEPGDFLQYLKIPRGAIFEVPDGWLRK